MMKISLGTRAVKGCPKCRNLIQEPWPFNPKYIMVHIKNPNKNPGFFLLITPYKPCFAVSWAFGVESLGGFSKALIASGSRMGSSGFRKGL